MSMSQFEIDQLWQEAKEIGLTDVAGDAALHWVAEERARRGHERSANHRARLNVEAAEALERAANRIRAAAEVFAAAKDHRVTS